MSIQTVRDIIAVEPELLRHRYFEFEDTIETCKVCAIGALVRKLPESMRAGVVRECVAWPSQTVSLLGIEEELTEHYGVPAHVLAGIQCMNDSNGKGGSSTVGYKASVLAYLDEIIKETACA